MRMPSLTQAITDYESGQKRDVSIFFDLDYRGSLTFLLRKLSSDTVDEIDKSQIAKGLALKSQWAGVDESPRISRALSRVSQNQDEDIVARSFCIDALSSYTKNEGVIDILVSLAEKTDEEEQIRDNAIASLLVGCFSGNKRRCLKALKQLASSPGVEDSVQIALEHPEL